MGVQARQRRHKAPEAGQVTPVVASSMHDPSWLDASLPHANSHIAIPLMRPLLPETISSPRMNMSYELEKPGLSGLGIV